MKKENEGITQYRYCLAATCFGIQAVGVGTHISFGVFFSPLMNEFGWSRATISGAASVAILCMGIMGIFVGRMNDRIGPKVMMTVTGLIFGAGLFLMSRLEEVWQLYVFYGVIIGTGLSSVDVIALSTIVRWFGRRRGLMTGIVKIGTDVGTFTIPIMVSLLITAFGWRQAYAIVAVAVSLTLIFIAQVLRRDPSQLKSSHASGLKRKTENSSSTNEGLSAHEAVRTGRFWIICAINLATAFSVFTIMVHIVPYAQDLKVSAAKAASVLATIAGVSMAGRIIVGSAIDRVGSKRAMTISLILLITAILWLQMVDRFWMLYVFATIYGLAHGSFFTVISPIVAEFFGVKAHGALFGIIAFFGTIGGAAGPLIAGYVYDNSGGYKPALWICSCISVLGLILVLVLKPTEAGKAV
ncbi:MAG: MFS transporter [Xanthomonadales bacterium]|nr:MFS transporter [Xanthomonadales bacterium]